MVIMNVVLYGDSNTYGYDPIKGRIEKRYSNILKEYFNNKINIYEEGLVGRTTIYDGIRPNVNALNNVDITLSKYNNIDLFVIMLGTNDLKFSNAKNEKELRKGLSLLISKILELNIIKKILIISPILLSSNIEQLDKEYNYNSYLLSKKMADTYKELSKDFNTLFLDAKEYAKAGIDGEHLDEKGHKNLGLAVAKIIEDYGNNKI